MGSGEVLDACIRELERLGGYASLSQSGRVWLVSFPDGSEAVLPAWKFELACARAWAETHAGEPS